jgi:hypothetical protein
MQRGRDPAGQKCGTSERRIQQAQVALAENLRPRAVAGSLLAFYDPFSYYAPLIARVFIAGRMVLFYIYLAAHGNIKLARTAITLFTRANCELLAFHRSLNAQSTTNVYFSARYEAVHLKLNVFIKSQEILL